MTFLKLGIVRGIFFGLVGTGIGAALTMLVRVALGLVAWNPGQVTGVGTLVGLLFYLSGLGAFRYWMGWVRGRREEEHRNAEKSQPRWTRYFGYDTNHKTIGVQYMATSLLVMVVAGIYQLVARLETAQPWGLLYHSSYPCTPGDVRRPHLWRKPGRGRLETLGSPGDCLWP